MLPSYDAAGNRLSKNEPGRNVTASYDAANQILARDGMPVLGRFLQAGYTWQENRTWCQTGTALRKHKDGMARVTDPNAEPKES